MVAPFWHLFSGIDLLRHFGRPLAPFGSPLAPFWFPLAPFWFFFDSLRLFFGDLLVKLWRPLAPFQHPLGSILKLSVTLFNFSIRFSYFG